MDIVTPKMRSAIMRSIKSKGTSLEISLRKAMWALGLKGWRINYKKVLGRPDIVFTKNKIAIFIDGCFWHGCPKCYRRPGTNTKYWDEKVIKNISRDQDVTSRLEDSGWCVVRIWEHEIKNDINFCAKIIKIIHKNLS